MTMIELGIVMGIVAVLLALVLGLGKHVNEIVKIRRAKADLGEWHETFNRWYLQFGEYPYARINLNGTSQNLLQADDPAMNLSNILADALIELPSGAGTTNLTFRSFMTTNVKHIDPWGAPYIYDCDEGHKSYILYSCGPDSHTTLNGKQIPTATDYGPDPTLDDIYFER